MADDRRVQWMKAGSREMRGTASGSPMHDGVDHRMRDRMRVKHRMRMNNRMMYDLRQGRCAGERDARKKQRAERSSMHSWHVLQS
jgi:hypothetical protein